MAKLKQPTDIQWADLVAKVKAKQAQLVSGTNIKTIHSKSLLGAGDLTLSASEVGAVPTTRKVNNKALSADITLSASDVSAVPTTRTVNDKALSSNITLTATDVGALSTAGGTITGNLTIKGSGNYGTKINLGDSDYVHISEPTDDCLEIKAKKINFQIADTSDSRFTINNTNPFSGGSGGGITRDLLYTSSTSALSHTAAVTLSKTYTWYEFVIFPAYSQYTSTVSTFSTIVPADNSWGSNNNLTWRFGFPVYRWGSSMSGQAELTTQFMYQVQYSASDSSFRIESDVVAVAAGSFETVPSDSQKFNVKIYGIK